jgi:TonB family protein
MTAPLDVVLRASLVIGAGLILSRLCSRQSAALRHLIVATTLAASALVPALQVALPGWTVAAPVAAPWPPDAVLPVAFSEDIDVPAPPPAAPAGLALMLIVVWLSGAVAVALPLVIALLRLRALARRATPVVSGPWLTAATDAAASAGIRRPIELLETTAPGILATWGASRPRILLPVEARTWSAERMEAVLHHEIAHVKRMDWLVQLAAEGVRALHWFNPLVWLACRQLQRLAERACDDAVLCAGVAPGDYARHLLEIARNTKSRPFPAAATVPMARSSALQSRVAAMLNPSLARIAPSAGTMLLVVAALVALAVPAAAIRLAQPGPAPLTGVVYDPTGAVLPGVELSLEDDRQNRWNASTDAAGRFEFAPVQPGAYTIKASLPGFKQLSQALTLQSASDWTRAVTLQVGDVRETVTVREQRPRTERKAAGSSPVPVRVGGNIKPPTKVLHVAPRYPDSMRDAGVEGTVPLEARIDRSGNVVSLRVLSAQVHPDLARAAMEAVQQWRFTPTLLNGQPVEIVMTVSIEFDLAD